MLRQSPNTRTSTAFWSGSDAQDKKLTFEMWQLDDVDVVHETVHYICQRWAPTLDFGYHNGRSDCTLVLMDRFWHSPIYRQWLRDRPWRTA